VSPRPGPVARQVLALQVLVVLVVVAAAVSLAYLDARRSQVEGARDRALAVAYAVADTPQVRRAVTGPDPAATIAPSRSGCAVTRAPTSSS
jgi:two-component system CitB family sensor kinase